MVFQAIVAGSPIPPRQLRPELDPASGGGGVARDRDRAGAALPVGRRSRARPVALRQRAIAHVVARRLRPARAGSGGRAGPPADGGRDGARLDAAIRDASATPADARRADAGRDRAGISTPSPPVRASSSRRIPALIGVLALAAVAVGAFRFLRPDDDGGKRAREAPAAASPAPAAPVPPAPRSYAASVVVEPPTARIELDGAVAGQGRFERTFPVDGADHTLVISAEGFETRTVSFRDAPPPARITLVARPPEVQPKPADRQAARRARAASARREKRARPPGPAPPPAQNPDDAPIVD